VSSSLLRILLVRAF